MWFASYRGGKTAIPEDLSHPKNIRVWFREQESNDPPAPDLDLSAYPAPRQRISIETAKKVNKLVAMVEGGEGQEQQTAKKYLKKQAEKFGMAAEELTELAKKTDPMRGVGPDQAKARDQNLTTIGAKLAEIAAFLKATQAMNQAAPLTREVVIALLDQVCDQLNVI
ncbi:hypothetical protein [Caballeronia sp. GAWG1-5s-s]|uniref:hypothetical protein n=1 Tax=Caballeronia sp. GAWG1-5s-s TaxID=2921743 RepID=UPI002028E83F|nr:hypothetical protein [Caballeronia sp. GAWG1-5s-s]